MAKGFNRRERRRIKAIRRRIEILEDRIEAAKGESHPGHAIQELVALVWLCERADIPMDVQVEDYDYLFEKLPKPSTDRLRLKYLDDYKDVYGDE